MDSDLLTCLLKFIEYFPDYLSALSRTLLRFFWTTFVETAVYTVVGEHVLNIGGTKSVLCYVMQQLYHSAIILKVSKLQYIRFLTLCL